MRYKFLIVLGKQEINDEEHWQVSLFIKKPVYVR